MNTVVLTLFTLVYVDYNEIFTTLARLAHNVVSNYCLFIYIIRTCIIHQAFSGPGWSKGFRVLAPGPFWRHQILKKRDTLSDNFFIQTKKN